MRERKRGVSRLPCYCSLLLPYGYCLQHNFPWGPVAILRDISSQYGTSEMLVRVVEDVLTIFKLFIFRNYGLLALKKLKEVIYLDPSFYRWENEVLWI